MTSHAALRTPPNDFDGFRNLLIAEKAHLQTCSGFAQKLKELISDGAEWQERHRRDVYQLLERAFDMLERLDQSPEYLKTFKEVLKGLGTTIRSDTSVEVLLIRAVYGTTLGSSTFSYATVLRVARHEKPKGQTLAAFIQERGGIEKIRRRAVTNPVREVESRRAHLEILDALQPAAQISMPSAVRSDAQYSLLLMRQGPNGKAEVVYSDDDDALLRAVVEKAKLGKVGREGSGTS